MLHFAPPFPLWVAAILAAACAGAAAYAYRRPLVPLTRLQRGTLIALRAAALIALLFFLCRPMILAPPESTADAVVPILVDASRSMAIADGGTTTRLQQAVATIENDVLPGVSKRFKPEIFSVGDALGPAALDELRPDANQSDLEGAIAALRDRYRGRPIGGLILVSDGADTGDAARTGESPAPVFAVGVGSPQGIPDREVTGIAAGDPRLDQASVDVHVNAVSRGFGKTPFDIRLSANGRIVDTRRVVPAADGAPIHEQFTVTPDAASPTVISAEIPAATGEQIVENNARSVLVSPRGRKRRVLLLEGAPGFEHSFLARALAADSDLDVDAIVRKGKNDAGQDTFFVQAAAMRASSLTSGFPARREDLFAYDAVIVANVSGDFFSRAQMSSLADFVAARGGGLLVLGGLSFAEHGLIGTPLEALLPVELGDRRSGVLRTPFGVEDAGPRDVVVPTAEGESHPVMRLGPGEDSRKKWAALPPLASVAELGGSKPGATVLAVASAAGGGVYPVIAVQQYGRGRSMVFGGEASWRWRMLLPATDRSYEFFWRQAVRWVAAPAEDPVAVSAPDGVQAGDSATIAVNVRDAAFEPVSDAILSGTIALPGGAQQPLTFRRDAAAAGRFIASFRADQKGVYHMQAQASRGSTKVGGAERWFLAGAASRELADPRLNESTLRRIARASGGRYVPASQAREVASWLEARSAESSDLEPRDLWQRPWTFAIAVLLLSAEWILRRRWGLR